MMGQLVVGAPSPQPCITRHLARFGALFPGDATANYDEALSLLQQDGAANHQRAEALLKKAVELNPKLADAYLQLGRLASEEHKQSEAEADFAQAIVADPQLAEAHYRLGVLYDREGKKDAARSEFEVHQSLLHQQSEAVEQQRRQIKQFVVTPRAPTAPKS